jgi:hypothetical protein
MLFATNFAILALADFKRKNASASDGVRVAHPIGGPP